MGREGSELKHASHTRALGSVGAKPNNP